jgi:hypothetical protein
MNIFLLESKIEIAESINTEVVKLIFFLHSHSVV